MGAAFLRAQTWEGGGGPRAHDPQQVGVLFKGSPNWSQRKKVSVSEVKLGILVSPFLPV